MRDWVTNLSTTHYLVGSAIGPHPFPTIVRDFQRVIGREIKAQLSEVRGKLPDAVVACVGGGSNAIGTFYDFIDDKSVRLIGVEAGGEGQGLCLDTPCQGLNISRYPYGTSQRDSCPRTSWCSARGTNVPVTITYRSDHRDAFHQCGS